MKKKELTDILIDDCVTSINLIKTKIDPTLSKKIMRLLYKEVYFDAVKGVKKARKEWKRANRLERRFVRKKRQKTASEAIKRNFANIKRNLHAFAGVCKIKFLKIRRYFYERKIQKSRKILEKYVAEKLRDNSPSSDNDVCFDGGKPCEEQCPR